MDNDQKRRIETAILEIQELLKEALHLRATSTLFGLGHENYIDNLVQRLTAILTDLVKLK